MAAKHGVLFINLGTPDDTKVPSVRRYLKQFLSDPRVLDIPPLIRFLLLRLVILPFRPKKSAEAYQIIWTDRGSPLQFHTADLTQAVAAELDREIVVRYAMRYQNPSLKSVLEEMREAGVDNLVVFPLYPQYASSSSGSCLEELYRLCAAYWNVPALSVVPPFYDHPGFLDCLAHIARESLDDLDDFDHFLISFHGLPERHVQKSDLADGGFCLADSNCCDRITDVNRFCYRAQSMATGRALAERLGIAPERYRICFQSRLGRTPWIQPYTDELITTLPKQGVKRLAVMVPSFTADCLETLEEIQIRGEEDFLAAGGEHFRMVPSLNAHPLWVETVVKMIGKYL